MKKTNCLTAMVTPINADGSIDWEGLEKNILFQIKEGVRGLVPAGTTGESPTLSPLEHSNVIARMSYLSSDDTFVLAGTGSNSTREMLQYAEAAQAAGCDGLLLVDCYYNGPSSLELRENYYTPAAESFPDLSICPYIIPGRTGCALMPEDLRLLNEKFPNINSVKEATGDMERVKETAAIMPEDFAIYSGDDDKTYSMMTDNEINGAGVISVMSNIAPGAVQRMCNLIQSGKSDEAAVIRDSLTPVFRLVGVTCGWNRFKNPVPVKTMMRGLGMPAGKCRRPLGEMLPEGVAQVRAALQEIWDNNPWILQPIEEYYKVDVAARLADDNNW